MGATLIRRMRRTVGLIWVALVVVIVAVAIVATLAPKLGFQLFVIRGASMQPAISLGSVVAVQHADPDRLLVGDVISIQTATGTVFTHRIISIDATGSELSFVLRGDANAEADPTPVPASAVIGKVVIGVPAAGYLVALFSLSTGFISLVSGMASLMLTYRVLADLEQELVMAAQSPDLTQALAPC